MEPNQDRSLILRPSQEPNSLQTVGHRILGEMVGSSLALAREVSPTNVDLDTLVRDGKRLYRGGGMTQEDIQAFELFYRAAAVGHAQAQFLLSDCYLHGFGVPKDPLTALEWLQKSAESGFAFAQFLFGTYYESGAGVPLDFEKADELFRKAAVQGNADAQCKIGEFYRDGSGGTRDYLEAARWYGRAAKQGNAEAQYEIALYYSGGAKNRSLNSCPDRKLMRDFFCEQLTDALANLLLGEKIPFDVTNSSTGEMIIPANRKITKTLLHKLANQCLQCDIASPPMRNGILRFAIRTETASIVILCRRTRGFI
jgi:hypothetical protein